MRALAVLLVLLAPAAAEDGPRRWVSDDALQRKIDQAIKKGLAHLRSAQRSDGRWTYGGLEPAARRRLPLPGRPGGRPDRRGREERYHGWDGGLTALVLYAMGSAGVGREDPDVAEALAWVAAHPSSFDHTCDVGTYSSSLLVLAFARLDAAGFGSEIRVLADRLAAAQDDAGMWGYKLRREGATADNSNTQLAVLGLWAAHSLAGWQAPAGLWRRVEAHYEKSQSRDGGWGYRPTEPRNNAATMTAAGVACWIYARAALDGDEDALVRARAADTARRGLDAFRRALRQPVWKDYYLVFSIERVGTVLGLRNHSWYEAGARILTIRQDEKGYWKGESIGADSRNVYETALALLFLTRATLPPRKGAVAAPARIDTLSPRERLPLLARAKTHRRAFEIYLSLDPDARRAERRTVGARGPEFVDHLVATLELDGRAEARDAAHRLLEKLLDKPLLYLPGARPEERVVMAHAIRVTWERMRDGVRWDNATATYRSP